jgi:hypothetical protein
MQTRMARLTLATAAALAILVPTWSIAQDAPTPPADSDAEIQRELQPKQHTVTEADVANCMKSWDPQTQMSRQEYEEACKRSLKYYPEQPN